ncbi:glycosyltransferase family 2 protein [Sinomicrobium weinanense]|uniref:Glycosyltransferase n=1 Tax=Sinomicrobium weinanense TaxID=2842200 RepID=A0A926JVZ3_9FLAO|nr:glycosyltransferase [Sinomicrobium weinanense]MBC9798485.1 glycosyltransferase [Sinomicrobium weinanense]MBU3123714.1 glycosyltransferase [Sinomicrobium weinanense]
MDFQEFKEKYQHKEVTTNSNKVENTPLVSVCVQTYEHAAYIRQCLDGILMQKTDFVYEILLGEDNSSDGTREICMEYAKEHADKIRLFLHHRENNIKIDGKPSGRFNFLYNLYNAKGKYIAICEGDDYWTDPLKLQKQVDFIAVNEEDYVGVYTNYNICDLDGRVIESRKLKEDHPPFFDKLSVFGKHSSQTLTVMYKNIPEAVDKMSEFTDFLNADRVLAVMMAQYGKIKYLDFVSGIYRWGSGIHSMKSARIKRATRFELYKIFKLTFKQKEDVVLAINQRMNDLYIYEICRCIVRGKPKKAFHYNNLRRVETGMPIENFLPKLLKYIYRSLISRVKNIWTKKVIIP